MRVAEFAKLRGVNVRTAIRWLDDGIVKGGKVGGLWMVDDVAVSPTSTVPVVASAVPAPALPVFTAVQAGVEVETEFQKKARESNEEAELLDIEARKAESRRRIKEAGAANSSQSTELLDEREKTLNERWERLKSLTDDLERREKDIVAREDGITKLIADTDAELGKRKIDSDVAIAKAQQLFTEASDKTAAELATLRDEITREANSHAAGIIADATLQAGTIVEDAKLEVGKLKARGKELDDRKAELDKGQTKLTVEKAIVERCMSRLNRDVSDLSMLPPKEWPGRIKTLIEFVKGELK